MSHALQSTTSIRALTGRAAAPLKAIGLGCLMVAALIAVVSENSAGFWSAWLHNWLFAITVGLGALLFVAIQHLTIAGWSVVVRRVAECLSVTIGPLAWLSVPMLVALLVGSHSLFVWNDDVHVAEDRILGGKVAWLNAPFFVARTAIYLGVWWWFAAQFYAGSVRADVKDADGQLTRLRARSGPWLIALGITITLASFDWIMSLDPHWFSSILGVYLFASAMVAGLAALTLVVLVLRRAGLLSQVTVEHLHDLGKLLYGFNCFWAYIAFSQYLLIWYANIPEETGWFYHRQVHGWGEVSIALVAVHFVLPFFGLMSRGAKRHAPTLAFWSVLLLIANWIDLYWLIMPSVVGRPVVPGLMDVLLVIGFVALTTSAFMSAAAGRSLIPRNDPLLSESLAFHNH
jgi:hypothetical protein